jgi:transcriptional regulator with XRE-family HTH domain
MLQYFHYNVKENKMQEKNAESLVEQLFNYYKVDKVEDLASLLDVSPSTVSNWRARNSVAPIMKKIEELGIATNLQNISHSSDISMFRSGSSRRKPKSEVEYPVCIEIKKEFEYLQQYGGELFTNQCSVEIAAVLAKYHIKADEFKNMFGVNA